MEKFHTAFQILAVFLEIIPELSNKQSKALRMSRHAVISLLVNIILLPKIISSEYFFYVFLTAHHELTIY